MERKSSFKGVRIDKAKWSIPLIIIVAYVAMGLIVEPLPKILEGLGIIYTSPSQLLTDYFAIAGIGAPLWNSASMVAFMSLVIRATKTPFTGSMISSVILGSGVAFFGVNIFNFAPILLGVYIYARFEGLEMRTFMMPAFSSTGLAPLVSVVVFGLEIPFFISFPLGIGLGVLIGYFMPMISTAFLKFHEGYNLYNVGFAAGIIGMVFMSTFKLFGYEISPVAIISDIRFNRLIYVFIAIYVILLVYGLYIDRKALSKYPKLINNTGQLLADFDTLYGTGVTMFNMGVMGLIGLAYIYIAEAPLNGPTVGAAFAVMGFAAMGKHPRNSLPIMLGVYLTSIINPGYSSATSLTLTAFFGTSLAPIAGEFGIVAGMLAGFLHAVLVGNLTALHAGVDLYNNGFSAGFIAALMLPVLRYFRHRKENEND